MAKRRYLPSRQPHYERLRRHDHKDDLSHAPSKCGAWRKPQQTKKRKNNTRRDTSQAIRKAFQGLTSRSRYRMDVETRHEQSHTPTSSLIKTHQKHWMASMGKRTIQARHIHCLASQKEHACSHRVYWRLIICAYCLPRCVFGVEHLGGALIWGNQSLFSLLRICESFRSRETVLFIKTCYGMEMG